MFEGTIKMTTYGVKEMGTPQEASFSGFGNNIDDGMIRSSMEDWDMDKFGVENSFYFGCLKFEIPMRHLSEDMKKAAEL